MNRTTVKRGIGAVILALIAAALLAFLLKDKAAQRQDVVDMALPGTNDNTQGSSEATRLPQLSTDNSGNGTVVAQAGQGNTIDTSSVVDKANETATALAEGTSDATGKVVASAAAVGAASIAATTDAAQKTVDFTVRAPQKASEEFRELDLVNNGENAKPTAVIPDGDTTTVSQVTEKTSTVAATPDQGTVIASTTPKKATAKATSQARLIDEKKTTAPKSARTAKVITKSAPAAKSIKPAPTTKVVAPIAPAPAAPTQAKNGYAIQLLATSSASRANDLKKVMSGEGYPTYVTKTQQNGKLLYRVRIGQYADRAAAAKAHNALKRRYKKNASVNRSAIVAR